MLVNEVANRWRGRRLSQITRAQVHEVLDGIADRGTPIRANRVFAQMRKMCRWAVARGIIDRSPCEGMSAPSPETRRDRVLDDAEMRLIWVVCGALGWPFGDVVRLLMLTGARRDEVAGMEWAELDLDAGTWTLPAERTKNKREHVVPLSDAALDIIKGLPRVEGRRYVFSTTGRTPVSGFSKAKAEIDKAALEIARQQAGDEAPPLPHWTLRDIRRSVATDLQRLGVRLEVTEAILGHVSGSRAGIVGVYQRHTWAEEKRAALDAWSRKLESIVTREAPSNVVELATSRG
jgi:integrase